MRSAARRLGGEKEGWTVTRVDRRVRTVEDDELDHHLRVVDGKQPRDGAAPVVTHQEATVVTSKHAKRRKKKKMSGGRERPERKMWEETKTRKRDGEEEQTNTEGNKGRKERGHAGRQKTKKGRTAR